MACGKAANLIDRIPTHVDDLHHKTMEVQGDTAPVCDTKFVVPTFCWHYRACHYDSRRLDSGKGATS